MKDLPFLNKKTKKKAKDFIKKTFLFSISINHLILFFLFLSLVASVGIFYFMLQIQRYKLFTYEKNNYTVNPLPVFVGLSNIDISAKSAIVLDKDSRTVVFSINKDFRFAPASSTKIMTAIIALENYKLDQILLARNINQVDGSKMGLFEGEKMSVINLLYGLLLPSGNDAAYVLAENFPGGASSFVEKMNEKAKELKLENTHFIDPSGYDDGNFTTTFDLARLASYALDNQIFSNVVRTKSKIVYNSSYSASHNLENLNKLLSEKGVTGVKTGYTEEAGGVLVVSFIYQRKTFIIVVLKSEDRFADTQEIISKIVSNIQFLKYN